MRCPPIAQPRPSRAGTRCRGHASGRRTPSLASLRRPAFHATAVVRRPERECAHRTRIEPEESTDSNGRQLAVLRRLVDPADGRLEVLCDVAYVPERLPCAALDAEGVHRLLLGTGG